MSRKIDGIADPEAAEEGFRRSGILIPVPYSSAGIALTRAGPMLFICAPDLPAMYWNPASEKWIRVVEGELQG